MSSIETSDDSERAVELNQLPYYMEEPRCAGLNKYSSLIRRKPVSTLIFEDIGYAISQANCCKCKKEEKVILEGITGMMGPGLNAILGPTGSGKTTLLDTLAGRKDKRYVTGKIRLNGEVMPSDLHHRLGYVVQEDMLVGTLTVRENIQFSASLRLPKGYTKEERVNAVEEVIKELGLTSCADTKIGNQYTRGVSGGEKKRTSIGMELITSPSILCLDEPTTGLDASTAVSVMTLLKEISKCGRTIIFSIHQPRYSISKLFDNITLLSKGQLVFHGEASLALPYFSSIGHECEKYNNPADFFLDTIHLHEDGCTTISSKLDTNLEQNSLTNHCQPPREGDVEAGLVPLSEKFKISQEFSNLKKSIQALYAPQAEPSKWATLRGQGRKQATYASNFFRQLLVVSQRTTKSVLRNPHAYIMQIITMIFLALVVGVIYFQIDDNVSQYGLNNRLGVFFFIIMNMVFTNLSAVDLFIRQKPLFIHENASGYYRVSAFFLAKTFLDLLPVRIFPIVIFSGITYAMIGFRPDFGSFIIYMLTLMLTATVSCSLAFAISAVVRLTAIGNLLVALTFVFAMVFGGFLISLESIAPWLSWLQYLSTFRYSMAALSINELKDQYFCQVNSTLLEFLSTVMNGTQCQGELISGNQFLTGLGYYNIDLWYNELALFLMATLLLLLAYVNLRLINKQR